MKTMLFKKTILAALTIALVLTALPWTSAQAAGCAYVARGTGEAPAGTPADWFPLPPEGAW